MAGRLEGHAAIIIHIWSSDQARSIQPEWQVRDVRRGTIYNVNDVQEDRTSLKLDLLAESRSGGLKCG